MRGDVQRVAIDLLSSIRLILDCIVVLLPPCCVWVKDLLLSCAVLGSHLWYLSNTFPWTLLPEIVQSRPLIGRAKPVAPSNGAPVDACLCQCTWSSHKEKIRMLLNHPAGRLWFYAVLLWYNHSLNHITDPQLKQGPAIPELPGLSAAYY